MTSKGRTRLALLLLVVAVVVVIPGGLHAYYLPKLAVAALAITAAACAPRTGRLPRYVTLAVAVGAVVLVVAALMSGSALAELLGRAPRYEGVVALTVYSGLFWSGARLLGPGADAAALRFFRRGLAVDSIIIAALYAVESTGARPLGGISSDRTGSFLGNATDAGLVGAMLVIVLAGSLFVERSGLIVVGIIAGLATVGFSESRAALLAAGIAFVIAAIAVLSQRELRTRAVVIAFAAIPVGIGAAVLLIPGALHRMTHGSAAKTVEIRLESWGETLNLVAQRPVLGVGPSGYADAILPFQGQRWADLVGFDEVIDSPHNIVLQAFSAGGVVLLLVAVAGAIVVAVPAIRAVRAAGDRATYGRLVASVSLIVGVVVALLTHFTTPSVMVPLLPLAGGLIATNTVTQRPKKGAPVGPAVTAGLAGKVWLPVGAVLALVLIAGSIAEIPLREAQSAALASDAGAVERSMSVVRALRGWDADAVSLIAQASAQGADTTQNPAIASLAVSYGLEARDRLGDSTAATLAAAVGQSFSDDPAQALPLFDEVIDASPFDDRTYVRRGVLRAQTGNIEGAIADFTAALAIDPDNEDAQNDLEIVTNAG